MALIISRALSYRLSLRALQPKPEGYVEPAERPRGPRREGGAPRREGGDRGPRRDDRRLKCNHDITAYKQES